MNRMRQDIENDAALWLIRRDEPDWDAAAQAELDAWLAGSMAHKAAFWRLEYGWRAADAVADLPPEDATDTVVEPRPETRRRPAWRGTGGAVRRTARWAVPAAATAAAAALVLAIGLPDRTAFGDGAATRAYSTGVGQAATIATTDGSRIELNTATTLRTQIAATGRDVWLDRGEAFFDVRHDAGRPFRVHAGTGTVTVLGTRFSVRRDATRLTVAVVGGRVRVEDRRAPAAVTVTAGDIAVAAGGAVRVREAAAAVEGATAWRDRMVVFDRTPLADAVAELNRYARTPIVIDDAAVGRYPIDGSFRVDNREGFLRLLTSVHDVTVVRGGDAVHLRRR